MGSDESWEVWVRERLKNEALRSPSHGAMQYAFALGGRFSPGEGPVRLLARLIFDSVAEPLPAGVRGVGGTERRVLYEAAGSGTDESRQLDLCIRREAPDSVGVTGQLLPPILGARVEARSGRIRRSARLGLGGEFILRGIPASAGSLRLEVRWGDDNGLLVPEVPLPSGDDEGVS